MSPKPFNSDHAWGCEVVRNCFLDQQGRNSPERRAAPVGSRSLLKVLPPPACQHEPEPGRAPLPLARSGFVASSNTFSIRREEIILRTGATFQERKFCIWKNIEGGCTGIAPMVADEKGAVAEQKKFELTAPCLKGKLFKYLDVWTISTKKATS